MRSVTILGAGLVGSLLSIYLRKKNYEVTVYERRPDMRKENISAGRSINFALSERGWKALETIGLKDEILKMTIPMPGRLLHQDDGTTDFQAYGKNQEAIYSISRGALNKRLMDEAEQLGVRIYFDHKCTQVDVEKNEITLETTEREYKINCDLLFGADGAFSSLRTAYAMRDRTNFSQHYIEHGYKELNIPAGEGSEKWKMEKNALHIWPRHNYMMIALPNLDGSFTCTLFFPFEGNPSFDSIQSKEEIKSFFQTQFPDALPLMPTLLEDFERNPISSLITTKISPWIFQDKSCLIGDAAHAIVPFYGQGLNAGFEDISALNELMEKHGSDWEQILKDYQSIRKENADGITELAFKNFVEMRDSVADPQFLERKKIEKDLGKRFPIQFNSVYEMVSFSHVPYKKAWKAVIFQDDLLQKVMDQGDYETLIKNDDFQLQLEKWIQEYDEKMKSV